MKWYKNNLHIGVLITLLSVSLFVGCKDKEKEIDFTDTTRPTLINRSPAVNELDVDRAAAIVLTFSEPMDTTTINQTTFLLKQGNTAIPGTISFDGNTAEFRPSSTFFAHIVYTVTVTDAIADSAGNTLASTVVWSFTSGGVTSPLTIVNLRSAGNFVILAKTAISNVPTSAITGNVGISPAAESYITGFALTNETGYSTSAQITGNVFAADMASPTPTNLTTAVEDMITAYNDAADRPSPDFFELSTGNIGGKTLSAGLYKWTSSVIVPASITISGTAEDVWIFQIAQNLTFNNTVEVILEGGAKAEHIFWQVAGEVIVGNTAKAKGMILSMTRITFGTDASLHGGAFAQSAVVLKSNVITKVQ